MPEVILFLFLWGVCGALKKKEKHKTNIGKERGEEERGRKRRERRGEEEEEEMGREGRKEGRRGQTHYPWKGRTVFDLNSMHVSELSSVQAKSTGPGLVLQTSGSDSLTP